MKTNTKSTPVLKTNIQKKLSGMDTKSSQIRYLDSLEYNKGDISRILSKMYGKLVRYQHVRNVLITPVKKPK